MNESDEEENLDEQTKRTAPVAYNKLYDSSDEEPFTADVSPVSSQEESQDLLE